MESKKHKEEMLRKSIHDIRSHLSVILSASELAILDEATITREDALAVIKTATKEVTTIMGILGEMKM